MRLTRYVREKTNDQSSLFNSHFSGILQPNRLSFHHLQELEKFGSEDNKKAECPMHWITRANGFTP